VVKNSGGRGANPGVADCPHLRYVLAMSFDYNGYFERRQDVCGGQTVVKGTRVTVRTLLASLAEGASPEEIIDRIGHFCESL